MMVEDYKELVANIKAGDTATANVDKWDPASWPKEAKGVGCTAAPDRKSTRLNSSHRLTSRMPSSA
jgi:Ni,Fe-hydrogenase I large subunit